jgi:glycosyltransferase involved in cell wall biosynthesis
MTRLALICDFQEEGWHSMNLVADQLHLSLLSPLRGVAPVKVRPPMMMLTSRLTWASRRTLRNFDRFANRFLHYPAHIRRLRESFDLFHVIDHSYSHLVHELPANRTIVTCHDVDTFGSVTSPVRERRSWLFRRMTERILDGFRKAAHIVCVSGTTRDEVIRCEFAPASRVSVIHNGLNSTYGAEPDPESDGELTRYLGPQADIELLHVGSTIPRKRIDLLLQIFARLRNSFPSARLIRVGGPFTEQQAVLASRLGVDKAVVELPYLEERVLASLYRRVSLVIQTSEAEGFGLPVAEALACGAVVVASDIPVLREIGGSSAQYCAVGDIDLWQREIRKLIETRKDQPVEWMRLRSGGISRAAEFRWDVAAARLRELYSKLQGSL